MGGLLYLQITGLPVAFKDINQNISFLFIWEIRLQVLKYVFFADFSLVKKSEKKTISFSSKLPSVSVNKLKNCKKLNKKSIFMATTIRRKLSFHSQIYNYVPLTTHTFDLWILESSLCSFLVSINNNMLHDGNAKQKDNKFNRGDKRKYINSFCFTPYATCVKFIFSLSQR